MKRALAFLTLLLLTSPHWAAAQESQEKKVHSIVLANGAVLAAGGCYASTQNKNLRICMPKGGSTKESTGNGYQIQDLACHQTGGESRPCSIQEFDAKPGETVPSCVIMLLGFSMEMIPYECPKRIEVK